MDCYDDDMMSPRKIVRIEYERLSRLSPDHELVRMFKPAGIADGSTDRTATPEFFARYKEEKTFGSKLTKYYLDLIEVLDVEEHRIGISKVPV